MSATELGIAANGNPERMQSEMSFAMPCGASPNEVPNGNMLKHRFNRDGIHRASLESHNNVISRKRSDERTAECKARRASKGKSRHEAIQ